MAGLTKLARVPLVLLAYAEQRGLNRDELMKLSSLPRRILDDPDSRVSLASVVALWQAMIDRIDDPLLGLNIGRQATVKSLGLVGYVMYFSETLFDALRCLSRYSRILSEAVRFEVSQGETHTTLMYDKHPSLAALQHPLEAAAAAAVTIGGELTCENLVPESVSFSFPRRLSPIEYQHALRVTPEFDAGVMAVVFSNDAMRLPVVASDPTLKGYLTELADHTLSSLRQPDCDFEQQVREALWAMLPHGKPDLWRTAEKMGVSARTLQRRLRAEGSSFSRVLENLRRDLSEELLSNPDLAVSEVAFLLGYSEPSAFQRAFRRWRGMSPRSYKMR